MAFAANRNLGGRADLQPGEYTVEDKEVLFGCGRCGHVDVLNSYDIAPSGMVTPPWVCPEEACSASVWLELKDWGADRSEL